MAASSKAKYEAPKPLNPSAGHMTEIRVLNPSLEDRNGEIILRGNIPVESLPSLRSDDYQREVMLSNHGKKSMLQKAVEEDIALPDIELGMRGQKFFTKGKEIILQDQVYIVDGLQRVSAILAYADRNPDESERRAIGCAIHFGTDRTWEKNRFVALNQYRRRVSPNVILRNQREEHPAILTLYGLSNSDRESALFGRVAWHQNMRRNELLSALTVGKTARVLHRRVETSGASGGISGLADILDKLANEVGLRTFRSNVKEFFDVVDECWGVRNVEYAKMATQLKGNFLAVVARLFAMHANFWEDGELKVDTDSKNRLKKFPIDDPEIMRLASAGGMAVPILYDLFVAHMNKGRSVNKLRSHGEVVKGRKHPGPGKRKSRGEAALAEASMA